LEQSINVLAAHHLFARGSRLDMAMNTGEIAVAAEINLESIDSTPPQHLSVKPNLFGKTLHARP
jgi:hypothetical protein